MIGQYFGEAWRVLQANKARSLLTLTGLIIGVMAVIAIQVLGSGMSGAVSGVLGSLNEQAFTIFPNFRQANFARATIRLNDIAKIKRASTNIVEVIPAGGTREVARMGHKHARIILYPDAANRFITTPVAFGRSFDESDVATHARVVLLTADGYGKLANPGEEVLGKTVRIGDKRFTVIGVLGKPVSGILSQGLRLGDIAIPYTTFETQYIKKRPIFALRVYVADIAQMGTTEIAVIKALQSIHKGKFDYQTFDRGTISKGINGIFAVVTFIVGLIGAVSLVVAGIGILNIMLVSVAERTREIGLRKAIGATRAQITWQFLIESLVLTSVGCGLGLFLGLLIGGLINRFALVALSGITSGIPWLQSFLIAIIFAIVVTLAFGTYPALRAASLDPIEALRYE
ncbi:MAG: ABC transporter permease [Candidatus Eremiobacteraeota bacterium]|nr:ABC transporter permease [Candidatus Eremiobacteraeota bacterium]